MKISMKQLKSLVLEELEGTKELFPHHRDEVQQVYVGILNLLTAAAFEAAGHDGDHEEIMDDDKFIKYFFAGLADDFERWYDSGGDEPSHLNERKK